MNRHNWLDNDDELLAELAVAVQAADVPGRVIQAAKASYTWRTIDSDLESLALSPGYSGYDQSAVRGASPESRLLSFEHEDISLEIEISGSLVRGQLYPVRSGLVTVVTAAGPFGDARTDDMGCFVADWPESGPVRIRCQMGNSNFITDWIQA